MDKLIELKKKKDLRKNAEVIPKLSIEEERKYIQNFFIHNNTLDINIQKMFDEEIKKKHSSYVQQDKLKKRYNSDSFITPHQIVEKMLVSKMKCYYCNNNVKIFYDKIRDDNQWTLERIDNKLAHTDSNTVISCLDCNLKRRTRNSDHFQFAKQLVIKKI